MDLLLEDDVSWEGLGDPALGEGWRASTAEREAEAMEGWAAVMCSGACP